MADRQKKTGQRPTTKRFKKALPISCGISDYERLQEVLVESEKWYRYLVEITSDWVWEFDKNIMYTYVSPKIHNILGYEPEEILGKTPYDLMTPEEAKRVASIFRSHITEHKPLNSIENVCQHKTGRLVVLETNGIAIFDQSGTFSGYLGSNRDITQRKQTEDAMEKLRHQREMILNSAGEGILGLDFEGKHMFVNPAAARMLGYEIQELIGQPSHATCHYSRADGTPYPEEECPIYATYEGGDINIVDNEVFWRKDGTSFPVRYTSTPIRERDKIVGIVVSFRDITERKQVEEALRSSEERFRVIFDNASDGILLADLENKRFHIANKTICQMLGYGIEEISRLGIMDIHPKETLPYVIEQFEKQARKEIIVAKDITMKRKDGSIFYADISSFPVTLKGKKYLAGLFRDITERRNAENQIQHQLQKLAALREIDRAISSSLDLYVTLKIFFDELVRQLHIDATDVLLLNPYTQTLEYTAGRGFHSKAVERSRVYLGEGHAGRSALKRRLIKIPNLSKAPGDLSRFTLLEDEGFVTYYALPLIAKGQVKGVLEIFHRTLLDPDQEWINFLEALAGQVAIAIDNAELFNNMQRANVELSLAYDTTLEGWSRALDMRDKETEGHTQRVTEMTLLLARAMKMGEAEMVHIRRGALLHDIGKMGVPDSILQKPGPLTDEEWEIMRKHPVYAYEMLSLIHFLRPALDIPYCHHEKWDGTGYPRGLKGDLIPLSARIFSVVDVWDALRSNRPYRPAWPEDKVREYLRQLAGKDFDSKVVEVFLEAEKEW